MGGKEVTPFTRDRCMELRVYGPELWARVALRPSLRPSRAAVERRAVAVCCICGSSFDPQMWTGHSLWGLGIVILSRDEAVTCNNIHIHLVASASMLQDVG